MGIKLRTAGVVCVLCLVAHWTPVLVLAQDAESTPAGLEEAPSGSLQTREALVAAINGLAPEYRQWVLSVIGLITQAELEYFVSLTEDYRRDAFMESFWEVRDPYPETRVNELRERWREAARDGSGVPFGDPRFMLYLLNGPPGGYILPNGQEVSRCFSKSRELEIWFYGKSERVDHRFLVILQQRSTGSPYEVYHLGDSVRPVQRAGGLPTTEIRALCADEFLRWTVGEISSTPNYEGLLDQILSPPLPSAEWLANLKTTSTTPPADAESFDLEVDLRFPTRRQSRTALQVMLTVPMGENAGRRFEGELFYDFQVRGEIIRDDSLFEQFRYQFEGPLPEGVSRIPLGFTRYLRPGPATLRLLVHDVFTGRFAQVVEEIEVPEPEGLPADPTATTLADLDPHRDAEGAPSLKILTPPGDVHAGFVRFSTRSVGTFDRVTFSLDGKEVLTKRRPPYSVELDLGKAPTSHSVRVVGYVDGQPVASDQIWLNQAAQRLAVRFIEPQTGGIYPGSVTARIDVRTPDGEPPERLDLFVNDEAVTSIEEPPYVHTLRLPGRQTAVIRAVAYLADGSSAEDAVIVNASEYLEEVAVELVELFPLVLDARGQPLRDLARGDFRVLEDGVSQQILRFEATREAPLHVALLIDRSASMVPHLEKVTEAGMTFARAVVRSSEDRIASLSFADNLAIDAGFGVETAPVERALAGLVASGGTAFYDSLVQALNFFENIEGQKALLVFSDGQDEDSRLGFDQALEAARHSGVSLYAVGLEEAFPEKTTRKLLRELASETGGQALFIADLDELAPVYDAILEELRSRYFLAYQSTSNKPAGQFRSIRVEVERDGASVRARQGYYP